MKFTYTTFSIIIGIVTVFMIAGLYAWIVFGLGLQNEQLQLIEEQNKALNQKQLQLQNTTIRNQQLIKTNEAVLHSLLLDIHEHVGNGTTLTPQQLRTFESEEPDSNHTLMR